MSQQTMPGTPLPTSQKKLTYNHLNAKCKSIHPTTHPIAKYAFSDYFSGETSPVCAANAQFIVYTLKNGLIRVIEKSQGNRTVLRGHSGSHITSLAFFSVGSDMLGASGGEKILIYRLRLQGEAEVLLEMEYSTNKLVWHPFNPNGLGLVSDYGVVFVDTTQLQTVVKDGHPAATSLDGASLTFQGHTDKVTDLDFSRDGTFALTSSLDGTVKVWELKISSGAACLCTVNVGKPVRRVLFVSNQQALETSHETQTPYIVTFSGDNEITLWDRLMVHQLSTSSANKIQSLILEGVVCKNIDLISGVGKAGLEGTFLLVSDDSSSLIHIIHIASDGGIVRGFDYISSCQTKEPVSSISKVLVVEAEDDLGEEDEENGDGGTEMNFFSIDSSDIQELKVRASACFPLPASHTYTTDELCDGVTVSAEVAHVSDTQEQPTPLPIPAPVTSVEAPAQPNQSNGVFSNWLGSLIAENKSDVSVEEVVVEEKTDNNEIGFADTSPIPAEVPSSDISLLPNMDFKSTSPPLLSPTELLKKALVAPPITEPKIEHHIPAADTSVSEPIIADSIDESKANKGKKEQVQKANTNKKAKEKEVPKLQILKREDAPNLPALTVAKREETQPVQVQSSLSTKDIQDTIENTLSGYMKRQESFISSEIRKELRFALKREVQDFIIPAVGKVITQSIEQTVTKPLEASLSKSAKESTKARTKEVVQEVSDSIRKPVTDAFYKAFQEVTIPAYEAATEKMFAQVSNSIEGSLASKDESSLKLDQMANQLHEMTKVVECLRKEVAELRSSRELVFATTGRQNNSVIETPDLKTEIEGLINGGDYEVAFNKALSSNDAALVLFACSKSDLDFVMSEEPGPALSQPLLLCLMQQLGTNLVNNKDPSIELSWLQEIVLVIDPKNPSIASHVSGVLRQVGQSVSAKSTMGDIDRAQKRQLQTLLQVLRGLATS